MLAPGEYLLMPAPKASPETLPALPSVTPLETVSAGRAEEPIPAPVPTARADEDEPRSFLLILLRALGAVHT